MLSEQGHEQIDYCIERIDEDLFKLSNNLDELRLDEHAYAVLTDDLDKIIYKLYRLRQDVALY